MAVSLQSTPKRPPFPNGPSSSSLNSSYTSVLPMAMGVGVGIKIGMASRFSQQRKRLAENILSNVGKLKSRSALLGPLACLSLAAGSAEMDSGSSDAVEPVTGVSFPPVLEESKQVLAGVGVRRKSLFGLANLNIYAFGIYADEKNLKENLLEKYKDVSVKELKNHKGFLDDVIASDVGLTVRLEIVYARLSISSVRSAYEESIAGRFRKFSGSENKELLQRFTSQFSNDIKLPRGTKVHITRFPGQVLHTKVEEKELASIQSQLLCRSLFDLYIGEDPLDDQAKEKIGFGLATILVR